MRRFRRSAADETAGAVSPAQRVTPKSTLYLSLDTTPTSPAAAYQLECLNISACNAVDACLALEAMPADGCGALRRCRGMCAVPR